MKLVMHATDGSVADTIDDSHPDFALWLERTPPGWSNGYVWVTAEDDAPDQLVLSGDPSALVLAHLPGQHDQQTHGRKRGGRLSAEIAKNEGFTYQPVANSSPTSGFAVSPYPERELVVSASDLSRKTINTYLDENASFVAESTERHVGGWFEKKKTNNVYLDVVVVKETAEEARATSVEFNQLAYFDLSNGEEVTING